MQEARHRSAAEQRREEAEDPRQVNTKSRKQRQKEEDAHHPVQKARVHRMTQQFARIDHSLAQMVDGVGPMQEYDWLRWPSSSPFRAAAEDGGGGDRSS